MININYVKQLLEIFDGSTVHDLRIDHEGTSIKLSKSSRKDGDPSSAMHTFQFPSMPTSAMLPLPEHAASPAIEAEPIKKYHEIRSPIVGTFYRSPSPDSPVFAEAGQAVSPGMVLCIIEAMKLMNEIECDTYGKIAKILVENAQPVEYNQVLFLIEPD